jgi:polyhydroxybutyrate depolymerase
MFLVHPARRPPAARALALFLAAASAAAAASADPLGALLEHRAAALEENRRSEGCGAPAPAETPETLEVGGLERRVILALPKPYDPDVAHALVIAFHGRTSPADKVRRYYDLERHATRPTIFVYPSGLATDDGRFTWSNPGDTAGTLRDYNLFDAIVRLLDESYCIDREKIFAVGHSLGAWFVNGLACARGDVLRAVGTLGGAISPGACRGETAAVVFHNPRDRLVPFARGEEVRGHFLHRGRLQGRAVAVGHRGFACIRHGSPDALNPVLWCPHDRDHTSSGRYYPHGWPSGTGDAIMSFFESLPPRRTTIAR